MMEHIHLIGIGGYGLSAIARVLHEIGYEVSGSDMRLSDLAIDLQNEGIRVYEGHAAHQIEGADMIVRSSAVPLDNPEIVAAQKAGIPVQKRDEFLGNLIREFKGIGVAGTHGKTTTTAMIAWMLTALKEDPSYIIGGISKNLGCNAHAGSGPHFVIEADEYDNMFLGLYPFAAIITNMEHDHPDCFPTPELYQAAFLSFTNNVDPDGFVLICADDNGVQSLQKELIHKNIITYGLSDGVDYQAKELNINQYGGYTFKVFRNDSGTLNRLWCIDMQVPGKHNVQNAVAALALADQFDLNIIEAAKAIGEFQSTGRRFDILGTVNGITIIDDYAHHPTEIRATLEAAKSRFPNNRIRVVWQPHTFSRTQTLFDEFITSFTEADQVIVTEIFASREKNDHYSAEIIVDAMQHPDVLFIKKHDDVISYLLDTFETGDVLLVLTAGDADQISKTLHQTLSSQEIDL